MPTNACSAAGRWDKARPATIDNLVLLDFDEADQHDAADLQQLQQSDPQFKQWVDNKLSHVAALYCARM